MYGRLSSKREKSAFGQAFVDMIATERLAAGADGTGLALRLLPAHGHQTRSRSSRITAFVLAGGLLLLLGYADHQLASAPAAALNQTVPVYLPDARFLHLVSLGYENALADLLWFRTINYFGKHYRSDRLYPWLARMCDVVTDLDPRAEHVYRFGGLLLPWEAGQPDQGIALLRKGLRVFPASWYLHFVLGFNYFFFKNDIPSALSYVSRASELPGAHPFVSRLAALLYAEQYGSDTAMEFLRELERTAGEATRAVISRRMAELKEGKKIAALEQAIATYRKRFGHLPLTLEDLVESRLVAKLPAESSTDSYTYDPDTGSVTSSAGYRPLRLYTSRNRQKILAGKLPNR